MKSSLITILIPSCTTFASSKYKINQLAIKYWKQFKLYFDAFFKKVTEPFVINDNVQPIALPKQMQVTPVGSLAVVSGWGATVVRITLEFDVVYFYSSSSSSSFPYGCRRHSTRSRLNIDFYPLLYPFLLFLQSSNSSSFFFAFFRRR